MRVCFYSLFVLDIERVWKKEKKQDGADKEREIENKYGSGGGEDREGRVKDYVCFVNMCV